MSNWMMIAGLIYLSLNILVGLMAYCVCSMAGQSAEIGRLERMTPQPSSWLAETQQAATAGLGELSNQLAC